MLLRPKGKYQDDKTRNTVWIRMMINKYSRCEMLEQQGIVTLEEGFQCTCLDEYFINAYRKMKKIV